MRHGTRHDSPENMRKTRRSSSLSVISARGNPSEFTAPAAGRRLTGHVRFRVARDGCPPSQTKERVMTSSTIGSGLRRVLSLLGVLALALTGVMATSSGKARAASSVQVFVGYADTLRANAANFPTP